jgi:2-alkenal reductase
LQQVSPPVQAQATTAPGAPVVADNSLLSAYQSTLETIYSQVDPSVVSIHVVSQSTSKNQVTPFGRNRGQQAPQVSEALGSGFVWDANGDIVTNNHVVDGATSIDVTFSDGKNYTAKVVGTDVYSDLAVIKSDAPASELHPVSVADASQVKVGQVTIAIGNPYGLQNTMTVGVVSGLGRTLPAGSQNSTGPTYSIPDIIQTDAAINPGNSGGVLLNDQGQVIGVTAAIESASSANAGIGFVIPSTILNKVIPDLIKAGSYQHPYLGLSGQSLNVDVNSAMGLNPQQQGALVQSVNAGDPAEKAGLLPSTKSVTIAGNSVNVGGDVIIAINGAPVTSMDDLIAYLETSTTPGEKVTLTLIRSGKQISVDVTLGTRPAQQPVTFVDPNAGNSASTLLSFPVSPLAPVYQ